MTRKTKKEAPAKPQRREPTENEKRAIVEAAKSFERRPSRPLCSLTIGEQTNAFTLDAAHSDHEGFHRHLGNALGSRSPGFRHHMIDRICNTMVSLGGGQPSENAINAAFAILAAIEPRDEVEGMLGAQIAATNDLSLGLLAAARRSNSVELTSTYIGQVTKLQRTMCTQLETLAKMRRGGEQVVRHIHVDNRGGQAVIAENVMTRGERNNVDDQSHEQGPFGPPLLGQDPLGYGVPMPSDQGQEALQIARGPEPGSTARK